MNLQEAANAFNLKTLPLSIEERPSEKNSLEKMNSGRSLFLKWQSPSRKLFLAMENAIYVEQRVQKGSFATT